jgi:hypothetical protein
MFQSNGMPCGDLLDANERSRESAALGAAHRGDRRLNDAGSVGVAGVTLKDIALTTLDGKPATLAELSNGATLVVNVASKCGLTPQYTALEKLAKDYGDRGPTIVGVPCNQFMGQEPGTADEIEAFCSTTCCRRRSCRIHSGLVLSWFAPGRAWRAALFSFPPSAE